MSIETPMNSEKKRKYYVIICNINSGGSSLCMKARDSYRILFTEAEAQDFAVELARNNPGIEYYVVKVVGIAKTLDIVYTSLED